MEDMEETDPLNELVGTVEQWFRDNAADDLLPGTMNGEIRHLVHETCEQLCIAINKRGLRNQLEFLLSHDPKIEEKLILLKLHANLLPI